MLILEVAAGVLFGLLLYRGLDSFSKNRNLTMPATIFLILYRMLLAAAGLGFIGFLLVGIYLAIFHLEYFKRHRSEAMWAVLIFLAVGVGFAVWSDIEERKKSKMLEGKIKNAP